MSKMPKSLWVKKDSSFNSELIEKTENLLDSLLTAEESAVFDPELITNLVETLDKNPALADFFFEKLLARPSAPIARLLSELADRLTSKSVHKGIRRTIYRLKQRGMDIPPSAWNDKGEKAGRGILKETVSDQVSGYFSEFDEVRNRIVALIVPQVSKGKLFVFALINPERGLESLTALAVSKKEAKGLLQDLEERAGHSFLSADSGQVALILKEAHDRRSNLSKEDEDIYAFTINLLSSLKKVRQVPIIRSLFPVEESLPEIPPDWERLTQIEEVAYYLPKAEVLEPYQKAVGEVQEAILILSPSQKRQQIRDIIVKGSRDIFKGKERESLVRYLEELAYLYTLKEQSETARVLFSAALFLAREGERAIPKDNPFLIWLVEKALSIERIMEDDNGQERVMEKTPGGIIIPPWVKRE
jgi:hypothetical protein